MKTLKIFFSTISFIILQWMDSKLPPKVFKILMTILKVVTFYVIFIGIVGLLGFVFVQISDKISDYEKFDYTPEYTNCLNFYKSSHSTEVAHDLCSIDDYLKMFV